MRVERTNEKHSRAVEKRTSDHGTRFTSPSVQPSRWFTCTECGGLFCDETDVVCIECQHRLVRHA